MAVVTGGNATLTIGGRTFPLKEFSMVPMPIQQRWAPFKVGTILDWQAAGFRPPHGRIVVDGLERAYILRCRLGPFGWAEQAVIDSKNRPVRNKRGGLKTRIVRGIVVFQPYSSRNARNLFFP